MPHIIRSFFKPVIQKRKLSTSSDNETEKENSEVAESVQQDQPQPVSLKNSPKTSKKKTESPIKKQNIPAIEKPTEVFSNVQTFANPNSKNFLNETNVLYGELCQTFESVESTSKRLMILDYLVEFLVSVIRNSPNSLLSIIYLCLNKLGPEYLGLELGIGESLLIKAIANSSGSTPKAIKSELDKVGDLGDVAQAFKSKQKSLFSPKPLTVSHVFKTLKEIAAISGTNSSSKKVDKINSLIVASRKNEAKFIIRSLEGKLRIGLAEQTVLSAIARSSILASTQNPSKDSDMMDRLSKAETTFKAIYNQIPHYDMIIPQLLDHGIDQLSKYCCLTPGIPLKPMLAHPTKSLIEVLNRFEGVEFTCEFKYDGERAQIHRLENGQQMVFSRNSENLSAKYPDILSRLDKICKNETTSYVLDCEAVAFDVSNQCILPFQVLSTRKRKDVIESNIVVQVCVFAFDLLYLNGEPVTGKTLNERRTLMEHHFRTIPGEFQFATYLNTSSIDEMQVFLDDSIVHNCEGLMVKTMQKDSTYEPSKRSRNWLKVKKDYLSGIGDTVDLVVIGAYKGRGKRTGLYGGFLLACYDDESEEYQSICKIGTGFSDEDLSSHFNSLKEHIIEHPKSYYKVSENPNIVPDVWFNPNQVWEVKCADLSISPVHVAAIGHVDPNKGISLRFPRFLRIRDDKGPEQATNSRQIADLYKQQQINPNNQKDDFEDE